MEVSGSPDEGLLVGLDIGGTSARLRIETAAGRPVEDRTLANPGWTAMTDAGRAARLAALVDAAMDGQGAPVALAAGIHGADSPVQRDTLLAPLRQRAPLAEVVNDSALMIPAAGLASGIGVTAGTGSSVTAWSLGEAGLTVGGWGWILGDEGGAVALVRDAARAVLDAHDAEVSDVLTQRLLARLDVGHPHGLNHALASRGPDDWAQAAPVVFDAAEAGSDAAAAIIRRQAEALALQVGRLQRRGYDVGRIVCAGAVLTHQPRLRDAFAAAVAAEVGAAAEITLLDAPPVAGAVTLARWMATGAARTRPATQGHPS